jgi:peptidoglycan-N-acetylglucosamine deacetylase
MKSSKPVLLTFDDGPCTTHTPRILDTLSLLGVKGLFFVLGQKLEDSGNRHLLRRILAEGHMVGNHSYTHANLVAQTRDVVSREIRKTQDVLESLGVHERIFRPPFGRVNDLVFEVVREENFWGLGWSADTADWNEIYQPTGWILHGFKQIRNDAGNIVLLHDIHQTTAKGIGRFVELLQRSGCTFPPLFTEDQPEFGKSSPIWTKPRPGWMVMQNLNLFRPCPPDGAARPAGPPLSTLAESDNSAS